MMNSPIVQSDKPVGLVGGSGLSRVEFGSIQRLCGPIVAADGGANWLHEAGVTPDAVIGDMDSIDDRVAGDLPPDRLHQIAEQDSTDFEKCLTRIDAPLILGAGFLGKRADHMLAACSALLRHRDRRCILLGGTDLLVLCPPRLELGLARGTRASLYPMLPVSARSTGLRWPLDGLDLAPDRLIATSNEVSETRVSIEVDRPGLLVILPDATLAETVLALKRNDARWPAPAPR